jgi:hypothetical protein
VAEGRQLALRDCLEPLYEPNQSAPYLAKPVGLPRNSLQEVSRHADLEVASKRRVRHEPDVVIGDILADAGIVEILPPKPNPISNRRLILERPPLANVRQQVTKGKRLL